MPQPITLNELRVLARTDDEGREKEVLSLHDRFFARVLAPPLAWLAIKLGLSADAVSFMSVLTALGGAAVLTTGMLIGDVVAVVLLQFSLLLDCADGDVARARGTACLDGYLRDVFRHYLVGPLIFCGLTLGVFSRHPDRLIILAGLLGAVMATRIVGDMADRVTLDGLLKRLKRRSGGHHVMQSAPASSENWFVRWLRRYFLPDMAIMNWLTFAVVCDAIWRRHTETAWLTVDIIFLFLAAVQICAKVIGLALLWRRGVSERVEYLASEIENRPHDGAI
ncbi:MAG: hypothetical protein V1899_12440 [Planctomycetota bacterium]